jgi:hypothetical protein
LLVGDGAEQAEIEGACGVDLHGAGSGSGDQCLEAGADGGEVGLRGCHGVLSERDGEAADREGDGGDGRSVAENHAGTVAMFTLVL